MEYRIEHDTMGDKGAIKITIKGAQTINLMNFKVGSVCQIEIIRAFAYLKNAAAGANMDLRQACAKLL